MAALLAIAACLPAFAQQEEAAPLRVLVVGNSLSYVSDLPRVLEAVGRSQDGRALQVDLLARGGARIEDHWRTGVAETWLREGRYDLVLLQERGGGLICGMSMPPPNEFDCEKSEQAHRVLLAAARAGGARVALLGTWQPHPPVASELQRMEGLLAESIGADAHVAVAEYWLAAREAWPEAAWHDADGMHPGPATSLLLALRIQRTLFGKCVDASHLRLHLRRPAAGLQLDRLVAAQPQAAEEPASFTVAEVVRMQGLAGCGTLQ